jgi:hypothetical protein
VNAAGPHSVPVPAPVLPPRPPADPAELDPLLTTLPAGFTIHRCYDANYGSRDFYAGTAAHRGRFHPIASRGTPLGVLYGATDLAGVLSETVFHDVPVRGVKRVPHAKLVHRLAVQLDTQRELRLIDLTSDGLRRLELSRVELIENDPRAYPHTAAWAQTLHDHSLAADGLLWVSRQHDTSQSLMLFGDRVSSADLLLTVGAVPLTLAAGAGLDAVCDAANRSGVTITGVPASS